MGDLIRTVDPPGDDEDEPEEDDLVLAKAPKGLFSDLVSEDENDLGGGWDFEGQQAVEAQGPAAATGLAAKIRARLEERGEAPPEEQAAAGAGAGAGKEPVEVLGTTTAAASHLSTGIHFSELRLSKPLLRALAELGFGSPTPIQRDVIPQALKGLDVLATAETGSGKTASFLLPALERLCQSANVRARKRDAKGRLLAGGRVATKALVLLPTRELAVQCHAMLRDLARFTMVTYQLVAGGFVSQDQASSLRSQPDIVVATPGRMLDHLLNTQSVHMELLEIVIFDEADRLLELGFREECMQVLKCCSKGRQTMLFSATHNTSVEELAKLALVKPVRVKANAVNRVAETLEQEFVKAPSEDLREAVLLSLCTRVYTKGVIIFCATKKAAHRLAMVFGLSGLSFAEIHGNMAQGDRVQALQRFQRGEAEHLLATDLAARGLDLQNVATVINFHLPLDASRYIHRVGRTARMGRTGRAVTIYTPAEYGKVKQLGKQCCSKVKSKVLKRTVASDAIEQWSTKIEGFRADIEAIGEEESLERELRLADLFAGKSENLHKHKAAIHARPEKTWYMTNGEKRKLKEKDAEDATARGEAAQEPPGGQSHRTAEPDDEEVREAKRVKRLREKVEQKRAAEKAERQEDDRRIRAAGRRAKAKNGSRAGKGEDPPPRDRDKKKKKNKKSKGRGKGK